MTHRLTLASFRYSFVPCGELDLHFLKEVRKEGRTKGPERERKRELEKSRRKISEKRAGKCEADGKKGNE